MSISKQIEQSAVAANKLRLMLEIRCDHCDALNAFSTVRGICADCFVAGHRPANCQPCRDEAERKVELLERVERDNF